MFIEAGTHKLESILEIFTAIENCENRFRNVFLIVLRALPLQDLLWFNMFVR